MSTNPVRLHVRKAYKMYVGGAFIRSESGRIFQVTTSPGETTLKENIPLGSRKDIRDAVLQAKNAWSSWAGRTATNRGQILYRLSEMLEARRKELVEVLESGGSSNAEMEVDHAIDCAISYAGWADKYQSLLASYNPVAGPHYNVSHPESMGVVGVMAPNHPALFGLVHSILPIIVSGNTCVVLASEKDPRTALVFCEALATSDLPAGVVNILTGSHTEMLPHLAKHMEVNALDLHQVDSTLVKSTQELACGTVKRVYVHDNPLTFSENLSSLKRIQSFVEIKTVWHPAGI